MASPVPVPEPAIQGRAATVPQVMPAPSRSHGATVAGPASAPERILQRLDWQVIRRLDGLLQGDYRSLLFGHGLDFANLREYQAEDDIRYIDWNVTARLDVPHVRQYHEDRDITAWFLLDLSPSVDFGTAEADRAKRSVLIDFVATLARLLTRHGNRVGAVFYGDRIDRTIPPAGGRPQVLRLINDLLAQPRLERAGSTDLRTLLNAGLQGIRRRSLLFLISDFISEPGWEAPLHLLSRRHEVMAVRLYDPREMELPDVGPLIMEDAETGEQLYVDTRDRGFRQRFVEAAERRERTLHEAFARSGVEMVSLSTDEDLVRSIVRLAMRRKRGARGPGRRALGPVAMTRTAEAGDSAPPRGLSDRVISALRMARVPATDLASREPRHPAWPEPMTIEPEPAWLDPIATGPGLTEPIPTKPVQAGRVKAGPVTTGRQ
jgi:hypothetical protein